MAKTTTAARIPMNQEAAVEALSDSLRIGLHNLLEGAQEDIREFALDISRMGAKVATEPDPQVRQQLLKSLRSQVKMLAELNRIRVVNESYATVERIIVTATAVMANVLVKSVVPPPI